MIEGIRNAWAHGARNVLAVAPTGSGKTVVFSSVLAEHRGAAVVIAHRQELVSQISLSLAAFGVRHNIIAQRDTVRYIADLHRIEHGVSCYDPAAPIAVAGVDTLIRRNGLESWRQQVGLWVCDEAAHLLRDNKWGKAVELFPNARGLGVTATPIRADGKGLGAHADGVFDVFVHGPTMRALIDAGHLADYRILCPQSDVDLAHVDISPITGDYNQTQLRAVAKRSHLTGDIVEHYKRHAMGRLGVTFVSSVEGAEEVAARYTAAGVPAAAVSAQTPDRERRARIRQLQNRELLQLVNVDLFGEGFDLPAISVCSMGRPTKSYALYVQQFGRALRQSGDGLQAIILDHVGNVAEHGGAPDVPRMWSLDRRERSRRGVRDPDIIPQKICTGCTQPYEAFYKVCPHCGTELVPSRRDGPEYVEGDLVELDATTLERMRKAIAAVDETPEALLRRMRYGGAPAGGAVRAQRNRRALQAAQATLRSLLVMYGGLQATRGRDHSEGQRRFWIRYGVDVMSAQALKRVDAEALACRLIHDIGGGTI